MDLRKARLRLGWTQARLAAALGVAGNTVARWERGERTPPGRLLELAIKALRGQRLAASQRRARRGKGDADDL